MFPIQCQSSHNIFVSKCVSLRSVLDNIFAFRRNMGNFVGKSDNELKSYVGKKYVDDTKDLVKDSTGDSIPNDAAFVRHSELPDGTRIVRPNSIITQDGCEKRLNLYLDQNDFVKCQNMG